MKTLKLTFILALALSTAAFARNGGKKSGGGDGGKLSVGVSIGAGIPMGNFGKSDTLAHTDTTHMTGYAKTGFHFNVNASYKFTDNIGAMIMIGGNLNGFNTTSYASQNYPPQYASYITTTATSHYVGSYLLGPCFFIPAGDKITVTFRALGGLMTTKLSSITEKTSYLSQSTSDQITWGSASTFGYNVGAGVKFKVTDMIGIAGNLDYLGGNPKFTTYTDEHTANNSSTTTTTSGGHNRAMSVGILNISVGAVLSF